MYKKIVVLFVLSALVFSGASCISFSGGTATGPMGTFRSSDKGETWNQIAAYPTAEGLMNIGGIKSYRLFEDPSDANAFYLSTRSQGLFYTYNNGDVWQSVPFFNGKFIYALAVDPKDKCTIYASDGTHIYKTEDCSRNWSLIFTEERTGERFVALDIDQNSGAIWGAEVGGDILASRDNGRSWTVIKRFGFTLQDLMIDSRTPGRIYVASLTSGLYRTDDSGVTWTDLRESMKSFRDSQTMYRIFINPAQLNSLFWVSKYGILRSDDGGTSWQELKLLTPPGAVTIYAFAVNPKNQNEIYYTGTILGEKNAHVRSTFYKSVDGGATWVTKKLPTNTIPYVIKIHPQNENQLIMAFTLMN